MATEPQPTLPEQAVALRRAGRSLREIRSILRIGNSTLTTALRGEPAPGWTRRPNAKDDLRPQAERGEPVLGRSGPGAGRVVAHAGAQTAFG